MPTVVFIQGKVHARSSFELEALALFCLAAGLIRPVSEIFWKLN